MPSIAKILLRSILKMVNFVMGIVGIAMVLYGLWMARVWQRDIEASSSIDDYDSTAPWFIYTFLSIGITLCLVTCIGHISADSSNGFCLSCYTVIIMVILLLEMAVAADILLNSDWEKVLIYQDLPEDPTGRFHDFKQFVESNFDVFKWIGLLIILAQGSCILLAMALRALGQNHGSNYDSDDEYPPARLPLINHNLQPPSFVVGDPHFPSKNDAWNTNK
ncbi:tetraspanin-19 isoform X1 [Hevea brasiliensis]|uniref:tetraspanin-19 isoform X1 n=1 Tax=Hevea brasiliensis TaxID=3981 RepID=UPI0025F9BB37|nr:tetraspanin-19 isoform X1 [Hevea brasiliensis]